MNMRYFATTLIVVLLIWNNSALGQIIKFPEGEIVVTFRANASGAAAGFVDFTNQKNPNLDFADTDEPVISVIFQKLKWNKGFKEYQFVLKQAWVNETDGFSALMPRLYQFKKGNRRIPLEIKKNGEHDLIIEFGILPPNGDINTVQPFLDKRIFKRVTVKGIKGAAPVKVQPAPAPKPKVDQDVEKKRLAELEKKRKAAAEAKATREAKAREKQEAERLAMLEKENKEKEARDAEKRSADVAAKAKTDSLAAEMAEQERLRLEEEARANALAAKTKKKKTYTPKEMEKKKEEFKVVKTENSFDNYINYIENNPDDPFVQEAIDSIKKIPIHFEIKEKVETSKDVFVFKIELEDVKDAKVEKKVSDSLLQTEIKKDNILTITTKDTERQNIIVRDTFERKLKIDIDPDYKTFTVYFDENEEKDSLAVMVDGGMAPFVVRFVQKGTKLKVCPQKVGSKYMISKSDLVCDLDGLYRVEVQDSRRLETKRSKSYFEFVDNSFVWLKFLWLPFIIILILVGYVIWRNL